MSLDCQIPPVGADDNLVSGHPGLWCCGDAFLRADAGTHGELPVHGSRAGIQGNNLLVLGVRDQDGSVRRGKSIIVRGDPRRGFHAPTVLGSDRFWERIVMGTVGFRESDGVNLSWMPIAAPGSEVRTS